MLELADASPAIHVTTSLHTSSQTRSKWFLCSGVHIFHFMEKLRKHRPVKVRPAREVQAGRICLPTPLHAGEGAESGLRITMHRLVVFVEEVLDPGAKR